jgi:hypothetical protein
MPYAIIDPSGAVRTVVDGDAQEAVHVASQFSPFVQVEDDLRHDAEALGGALGDIDLGRVGFENRPRLAFERSGLPHIDYAEAMAMSAAEAHQRLLPFFPTERFRKSGERIAVNTYATPRSMADALLGQNYKTAKKDSDQRPADVQGLSLVPQRYMHDLRPGSIPNHINLCVGASKACVQSCLVYSGHNTIDPYNLVVKIARTQALIGEPLAFVRLLGESITRFQASAKRASYEPYVRLNVFSDIPWELVCPGLFAAFSNLQFYDYTKVEGRNPPSNYDITFSFSGVNQEQVNFEIGRGRRIAVVFIPPERIPAEGRPRGAGLPTSFLGLPVIDGDVSDVRPRDAAPAIVGLRWKVPMGRQKESIAMAKQLAFAVPVTVVDGQLIAATSARQEPIADADEEN